MQFLSQKDADFLLAMLKRTLQEIISFPDAGLKEHFEVQSLSSSVVFTITIERMTKNPCKYNLGARIKGDELLLFLHINPSGKHYNPDGEIIYGNHWHVYREGYDMRFAYPAEDIDSSEFVHNTIVFLEEFNVVEKPEIRQRLTLLK